MSRIAGFGLILLGYFHRKNGKTMKKRWKVPLDFPPARTFMLKRR